MVSSPLLRSDPYDQERRRHQRVRVAVLGRYMLANRQEFPCQTIDMSPGGVALVAPVRGALKERVICYIDQIGRIEGSYVTTVEGLSRERSHPLQLAFLAEQVPQCGYCQSGMIMAAAALLARDPNPDDAAIDAAITNICRCGTYPRIRRAIRRAARVQAGVETIAAAPPPGIDPADAARAIAASLHSRPALTAGA